MARIYYSQRNGINPNFSGLSLNDTVDLFVGIYDELNEAGYFAEAFGYWCVNGDISGSVRDIDREMLLRIRKRNLWPPKKMGGSYSEDDFFDVIEFLYDYVSKPMKGQYHGYNDCGMHWDEFDKKQGEVEYVKKINAMLSCYSSGFEMSVSGEVLHKPESGFEGIFDAEIPTENENIIKRINSAKTKYLGRCSTLDDRRYAVNDLAHVLEYIKKDIQSFLTSKDESGLFNIANNFGIRHHNDKQKTSYDMNLWLSWMFYFFLATIHVVLRKKQNERLLANKSPLKNFD